MLDMIIEPSEPLYTCFSVEQGTLFWVFFLGELYQSQGRIPLGGGANSKYQIEAILNLRKSLSSAIK